MKTIERPRVKSFIERKSEEAELLQKKEQQIKQHLNTIKNNPKFFKVLNISLNIIENLISIENLEYIINIHCLMKLGGIKIICNIASVNSTNKDIVDKTTNLLKNFIKNDNKKTYELSKYFLEKSGQNDIFQLLISLRDDKGIKNLLEIIYILLPIPQFFNILIESEMIDTIKFLVELNEKNIQINILYKIISKITNHKKGRELLITNEFIKKIVTNMELNIKNKNFEGIYEGLIILDNILKVDNGKKIIKELNILKILAETLSVYFNNIQISNMINKLYSNIISVDDIKEKINKIKNSLSDGININGNIDELLDLFGCLSNYIQIDVVGKIICTDENINLIINFFCFIYSVDLIKKNEKYLMNFILLMKYFLIIFKRMIEFLKTKDENLKILLNNKIKIYDSIKKIYECINQNKNINENEKTAIINEFKSFFSEYCDIFMKLYKIKEQSMENNNKEISILEYILDKIIKSSDELFYKDEKVNYYFSFLLKIILTCKSLDNILINCFPYFINIINFSQNKLILSNFLDVIYNLITTNKDSQKLKKEIIPSILKFMSEKPNFRYPNLINLKILNIYLNSEINNNDENDNNIDYIGAICSVMAKGNQPMSVQDIEKKILIEGCKLLKKLISTEYYDGKIQELNEIIKIYKSEDLSQENIENLKKNIFFHISVLNLNEYLIKNANDILNNIKNLITKEINYIENYKKEKTKEKEINESYKDICSKSTTIINLCLNILRKIEDGIIINFLQNKDDNRFTDLIKSIIELNIEIINNSTDSFNLINHLRQLKKNILFLVNNEKIFKFKEQTIFDIYINSLINLFRKNIYNENICLEAIKTLIIFTNNKSDIYNILIKKGFIKLILQLLSNTTNSKLCYESIQLMINICFSGQKNLIELINQNILNTLFEIHTKFINDEKITNDIDLILNEVKKLPGQGVHIEDLFLDAIKNFNQNIKNDFNNNDIKFKLIHNLIIINSYTVNKFQIKKILNKKDFINNFLLLINKTLEEKEFSKNIDKLFTCEIELMKKIIILISSNKENTIEENIKLNQNLCDILLIILFHKSIFAENFLLACTTLLYYIQNEYLFSKFLNNKIDKKFIEQILEQEENYSDNFQILKVLNKIISYLALKNTNFAKYIIKKGGFINIINELKSLINLNDAKSKIIKYNSLIMIESLLNDDNNMEIFIQSNGFELINNIIQNEVNLILQPIKTLSNNYQCLCCINCGNCNINKNRKSNKIKNGIIANDIIIEENYFRSSSKLINIRQNQEIEDNLDKDNNYILFCMKIINKCLHKDKKEFMQKIILDNLIIYSEEYFPDKNIFSELIEILSFYIKDDISKQNEDCNDLKRNKNIIKLLLSNISYFYTSENLIKTTFDISDKIGELIFKCDEYISEYKKVLNEKYDDNDLNIKFKIFTYLSLVIELNSFKNIEQKIKFDITNFFNDVLFSIKNINKKIENNNISNYFINSKEGIILSLIKIYNYLINNNFINENNKDIPENINFIEQISIELYIPNNFNFVYEYEKEISKLINTHKYTKNELFHLKYSFNKLIPFVKDFSEEIKFFNDEINIIEKKEINLSNILLLSKKYYKIHEDKNIKIDSYMNIFEELIGLLHLFFNEEDESKEDYIKNKDISNIIKLIWKIIFHCLQLDLNNKKILFEKILEYDIFSKLTKTINNLINIPYFRKIPLILAEKNESNNDLNELLYDFTCNDIKIHGKLNEKIKKYDIKILSNLSKNFSIIKLIIQDKILSQILKDEYSKFKLLNEYRLDLATIFRNLTKNNNKLDTNFIQIIFSKVLKDPIKSLENGGKLIAEIEIESVINIMKNKNLFGNIIRKNIVNNDDIKKIETIYDHLDKNICKQFKHILIENEVDKKIKQSLKSINEDEESIEEIGKIVLLNYEKHALEYAKFFDRMKKEELILNTVNKEDKKILSSKDKKQENKIKEKIKTSLSMIHNQKIYLCISEILLILIKNFNLVNLYRDDQYNFRRIKLIDKSFNLLQLLSLTKDNHLAILEEGLINLLEKINEEYKLIQKEKDENNNFNKFIFNSLIKAKFILKECSQYETANELILDSSLFSDIISEIMNFQNALNNLNTNGNLKKMFIYDNNIISNIFSVNKFHEQILDKLNIDIIIELGLKNGNIIILENIADLIILYLTKNNIESKNDLVNKIFSLIEKSIKNKNSSSFLLLKIYQLISELYNISDNNNFNIIQKIENLKLIESININIKKFSHDNEYIYSAINCLVIVIKNNKKLIEECFSSDLIKNIKNIMNNYSKEIPPNYTLIIWKVSEFYYLLIKSNPQKVSSMCELKITLNIVNYLDIYNNKALPKIEDEKKIVNKIININYIAEILMNCINYLYIITSSQEGNDYLSTSTSFNKYIILALENENHDKKFLNIALKCLYNYFGAESGLLFLLTNIVDIYHLFNKLYYKYKTDIEILLNMNKICGIIINYKKIDKNYIKNFFEILIDNIKLNGLNEIEQNLNFIMISLNIIRTSLDKNNYLVESINTQLINNIINILTNYKENYEIQYNCYKIISFIIDEKYISNFSNIIKDLFRQIKECVSNFNKEEEEDKYKKIKEKIKESINDLIIFLSNIKTYSEFIISEILIPFIQEIDELNLDEELKLPFILNILYDLIKNKNMLYIKPFINGNGLDKLLSLLKTVDKDCKNIKIILVIFNILKNILKADDDYKIQLQNLNLVEIINNILKLKIDQKIEFEGRNILFLINKVNVKLEKIEDIDYTALKIVDPIKPMVKNYLTSGRHIKIINKKGEIKEMQLLFSQDLAKIQAKLIRSNLPPKQKYVIETNNIKSIIKGHGTNDFKKCGGIFKSIPKAENCFSIIGPLTEDGKPKTLNIICNSEKDVDLWIRYMEIVINYFKERKLIGYVNIIKETQVIK